MWRKGNLFSLLVRMKIGAATVESSMEIPQKLKMELLFEQVILLLEIYLKKSKILIQMNISTPVFIAALFTNTKIWKQPKCPSVDEWIKQLWDIYTNRILLNNEKEEKLTLCNSMDLDLENTMLSEISQSERDKYHMISFICGI